MFLVGINKKNKGSQDSNGRINFVSGAVFLFGALVIARLYFIQVAKRDFYYQMASSQHTVLNYLEPSRGKIYLTDKDSKGLYPIATNKDFAWVFAVPKDIKDPSKYADNFYNIFDKTAVEREVEDMLNKEFEQILKKDLEYIKSLNLKDEDKKKKEDEAVAKHEKLATDKTYQESRKQRKEVEIERRKKEIITAYQDKLSKKDDPYELIKKKVDDDGLRRLYAYFLGLPSADVLVFKEGKIFKKEKGGREEQVKVDGLDYNMVNYRFYPEGRVGSHLLGFVRYDEVDGNKGSYGLEGFFDEELIGKKGLSKSEKGAVSDFTIFDGREYTKQQDGSDLVLTIDRTVQFTVCNKLVAATAKHGADLGSAIVMDPQSGAIIAMCSWPDFDPNDYKSTKNMRVFNNPALFDSYEPGSVFKTITMAAAIDQGKVTPETTYNDLGQIMINGWPKPIKNSDFSTFGGHGITTMKRVLDLSLNTGAIYAMKTVGPDKFVDYLKKFGFFDKTGIELAGESDSNMSNVGGSKIQDIYAATASFGQGVTVTPLQMINSYAAIANGGNLMKPYLVKEIIHSDGTKDETRPRLIRRVISERTASLLQGMLISVVENGHSKRAGVSGYYVGGKTGTAQVVAAGSKGYGGQTNHTLVGFAPANKPKFVMLIRMDNPKDAIYAESTAAPLFGEIAEFLLQYYQVPKEREVSPQKK